MYDDKLLARFHPHKQLDIHIYNRPRISTWHHSNVYSIDILWLRIVYFKAVKAVVHSRAPQHREDATFPPSGGVGF